MFDLNTFVANPTANELVSYKKSQIIEIAQHYTLETKTSMVKQVLLNIVAQHIVDEQLGESEEFEALLVVNVPAKNGLRNMYIFRTSIVRVDMHACTDGWYGNCINTTQIIVTGGYYMPNDPLIPHGSHEIYTSKCVQILYEYIVQFM